MTVSDLTTPTRPRLSFLIAAAFLFVFSSASFLLGQADAMRPFSIVASDAETSFRQFSEQAGVQFIYSAEKIRDVRTNAIKGDFTPRQAIDRMLEGTPLVAVYDSQTGALSVDRTRAPSPDNSTQKKATLR